jgi:hypothetical protein
MDGREQGLSERWHVAMQQYWAMQLQISREHLLFPDGAPTRETMQRADAARTEAAALSRQIVRSTQSIQTIESLREPRRALAVREA